MIGQKELKFGKERLSEFREQPPCLHYVIRNKPKIIQLVSRQGVSQNQLAMRPQAQDPSGWLVQLPRLQNGNENVP